MKEKTRSAKASSLKLDIASCVFVGIIVVFTVYPIIYTLIGAFKSNAELTLGSSFFPRNGTLRTSTPPLSGQTSSNIS